MDKIYPDPDYDDSDCKCGAPGKAEHYCPYDEEMGGGFKTCNCCNCCMRECKKDV